MKALLAGGLTALICPIVWLSFQDSSFAQNLNPVAEFPSSQTAVDQTVLGQTVLDQTVLDQTVLGQSGEFESVSRRVIPVSASVPLAQQVAPIKAVSYLRLFELLDLEIAVIDRAAAAIDQEWHPGTAVMLVEILGFARNQHSYRTTMGLLKRKTGQNLGEDLADWYDWIWKQPYVPHPEYAAFKAKMYSRIDKRFAAYFRNAKSPKIRLDEIRWGGVLRDGIPPLKNPKMLPASKATYLADSDVVFGVNLNGDARCYPKRILAWHEMFKDTIGSIPLCGVYCTLCGSVIMYEADIDDTHYELGTSGFLYRSNKLMYDHATESFWSTLTGEPVVGPLVGKGIELKQRHVVTTTWGEWKRKNPKTTVLSLDTGHRRDYGEGVAYRDYFATDALMFSVPKLDRRLKNKDEVLALRDGHQQLAISARYLNGHPVYHDQLANQNFVVLTDQSGANRVYESNGIRFQSWDQQSQAVDRQGRRWDVSAEALRAGRDVLKRLPAHRAFWFAWSSQFPKTRLVK